MTEYHKINCPRCGVRDSQVPKHKWASDQIICPCGAIAAKVKEEIKQTTIYEPVIERTPPEDEHEVLYGKEEERKHEGKRTYRPKK